MNGVAAALKELWGLFVEDASFSIAIAVCIAAALLMNTLSLGAPAWRGAVFFLLLALALVENVWRTSRRRR